MEINVEDTEMKLEDIEPKGNEKYDFKQVDLLKDLEVN